MDHIREEIKKYEELLDSDIRWESIALFNEQTGESHPYSLKEHYDAVAFVTLNKSVPEDIKDHFLTAKHLWIYSWYVYGFVTSAQLQAYGSLEYALRERLGHSNEDKPPTLFPLLQEAIRRKLLNIGVFTRINIINEGDFTDIINKQTGLNEELIILAISKLRNNLAHGSFTLMPDNILPNVADAINQLYPD